MYSTENYLHFEIFCCVELSVARLTSGIPKAGSTAHPRHWYTEDTSEDVSRCPVGGWHCPRVRLTENRRRFRVSLSENNETNVFPYVDGYKPLQERKSYFG